MERSQRDTQLFNLRKEPSHHDRIHNDNSLMVD